MAKSLKAKRTLNYFSLLKQANPQLRQKLLSVAPKKVIGILSELALNIGQRQLPISRGHVGKLRKHKRLILQIGSGKRGLEGNRRLLAQSGGAAIVPILLSAAGALLPSIIEGVSKLFGKKQQQ